MFEEAAQGGSNKKKKWIMIAIGGVLILLFVFIRNAGRNASAAAAGAANAQANNVAAAQTPTVVDTGAYPDLTSGGGAAFNQTMSTYLAMADQNTSTQMSALNNELGTVQNQMNTQNQALQDQMAAINASIHQAGVTNSTQPVTTTTPATTAHPDPASVTDVAQGYNYTVKRGDSLYHLAVTQYGTPHLAMTGGINTIAKANNIANPNRIYAGQKIFIPNKMS